MTANPAEIPVDPTQTAIDRLDQFEVVAMGYGDDALHMTAVMWIDDVSTPIGDVELSFNHVATDGEPYTLLEIHSDSGNSLLAGVAISRLNIGNVPALHELANQSFSFDQTDGEDQDHLSRSIFWKPGDETLELQSLMVKFGMAGDGALPLELESTCSDRRGNHDLKIRIKAMISIGEVAPVTTQPEYVFTPARLDAKQLQLGVIAITSLFGLLAGIFLWNAVSERAVALALVPVALYSVIGVAVYFVGMKYLRTHYTHIGISGQDWLRCEQVLVAADNGVILKVRFGTAYLIWDQLLGVAKDDDNYYLLVEAYQGFMVPKQALQDPLLQMKLDDLVSLSRAKGVQGS